MEKDADGSEGRTVVVGGVRTHYHDVGAGPVVVLLHGSGPGVSAWANWHLTIPALAGHFRVLAPDIVGYGSTERPEGIRYGVSAWLGHVTGFLAALGVERAHFVGNSMGGRLTLGVAHDHPELVDRIVLMGTGGMGGPPSEGLKALRDYQPSEENMRRLISECFVENQDLVTPELVHSRYEASSAPGAHEAYRDMFHSPDHDGSRMAVAVEDLPNITAPALLVHGFEDKVIPVLNSWKLLGLLPDAQLHVFKHCGHWAQLEHGDEFNVLVSDFLSRA